MTDIGELFDVQFLHTLDRLALVTRRPIAGANQGERRSPRRGSSVEFADYKPYVAGDDFRQIDWNLYARLERFFLKLFVAEEEITLHLLVDASASMDWGQPNKLRYAARAAGALGYIALAGLDRTAVHTFGGSGAQMRPVRGRSGAMPMLRFLSGLRAGGTAQLYESCRKYAQTTTQVGPLLLTSDMLDERWREALTALRRRPFEITVLHILSPEEINPVLEGDLRLIDVEGGEPVDITADQDLQERYRENLATWRAEVEEFCGGHDINYVFIPTTFPIEELLLDILRRRGLLR